MNNKEPSYFLPALIGGSLAGFISAVSLNCLCCLWVIAGGFFSAYLLIKQTPFPLKTADGLLVGVLSGVFAAIINSLLAIPLSPVYFAATKRFLASLSRFSDQLPSGWNGLLAARYQGWNPTFFLVNILISGVIFAFFGAIGGLIGYSLYEPKKSKEAQNETPVAKNPSDSQPSL
ncbi:MAG: hypothetical protein ACPLZD_04505 [Candidatus Saccharicenans sp.]|nr:MAG: hypothetical protein C0168_05810 [Candidatus Aminicenantes bacterium]HEK86702.1 hypothetical protein [Candidatus Aminicenantes bacterium]